LSENIISSIQQIILSGKGDSGRLEYILELLTKGRPLPLSDQKYIESIIPLYLGPQDIESVQRHAEQTINSLQGEIKTLDERLGRLEKRGFERYIGKKAVFFFVTVFFGWHAFQNSFMLVLGPYLSSDTGQYLFPLDMITNNFGISMIVGWIFTFMALAWTFIGIAHLARFIISRKSNSKQV
jgi:hypothetical protein